MKRDYENNDARNPELDLLAEKNDELRRQMKSLADDIRTDGEIGTLMFHIFASALTNTQKKIIEQKVKQNERAMERLRKENEEKVVLTQQVAEEYAKTKQLNESALKTLGATKENMETLRTMLYGVDAGSAASVAEALTESLTEVEPEEVVDAGQMDGHDEHDGRKDAAGKKARNRNRNRNTV